VNEADDFFGDTRSPYDSHQEYTPLVDLHFKKIWSVRALLTIVLGAQIVLALISTSHYWWAAAAAVVAIGTFVFFILDYTVDRVRIFKDGILASHHGVPWRGKWGWKQFPWDIILHLDFSDKYFRIATVKDSRSHGHIFSYMGKMDKKEKNKLINDLKSHQQRGDIPSTIRFI
jgi:hypothetical protein